MTVHGCERRIRALVARRMLLKTCFSKTQLLLRASCPPLAARIARRATLAIAFVCRPSCDSFPHSAPQPQPAPECRRALPVCSRAWSTLPDYDSASLAGFVPRTLSPDLSCQGGVCPYSKRSASDVRDVSEDGVHRQRVETHGKRVSQRRANSHAELMKSGERPCFDASLSRRRRSSSSSLLIFTRKGGHRACDQIADCSAPGRREARQKAIPGQRGAGSGRRGADLNRRACRSSDGRSFTHSRDADSTRLDPAGLARLSADKFSLREAHTHPTRQALVSCPLEGRSTWRAETSVV